MVAGMLTSLDDLKSIYEVLFRDGVMVSKKDMRPQCMHPDVQGVPNLKVIRAMVSLKSRGFVRETFAWRHSYWYLTNEGIAHVREFLHLPPEIVPSTLQRVRSTVSTLHPMRRAANVQKFKGPTSFVPKPRTKEETQEDVLDRQGYRSKKTLSKEPEDHPEKMVMNFRGSYAPKPSERETGHQEQRFGRRTDSYREEERGTAKSFNKRSTSSYSNAASRPATREAKIETPVKKQQEEPEPSQSVLPEEEKISAAAAMPDSEPTKKSIETVQPFIDLAEESIISPYETVEVDMPVPLMEAVDVELCYAKTEAPQPVSDMPAEESAQSMEIASDQVSTDLEVLVEEGIAGEVQEPEESTEIQEQVEVIVEPKEDVLLEQSGPEIYADSDVPLAASPVDDDQTVSQEVQESLPEILEPKEQTEEKETFEEPLHQEDVMMHAPDEPKPVVSDESITLPSTYDEPEAAELDEEVTEVLQEIMVAKDAEELPSVEEVIAAEPAVENEEVLVQKPVADDWLMVSHDEPEGGEQDSDEDELHLAQESAEFGKQNKEVEVVMVQEEIIHAGDVMQAMDDPNVPPINTSDVAQNIQEEHLPHIADLEPPVEEMPTSIPAVTSVTPEDVESWQTGLSSLLLSHLPPTMDPSVVPAELEVQDTAVLHGDLNINPPPEDFTALHPGVNVKHPSEEEEKGAAE